MRILTGAAFGLFALLPAAILTPAAAQSATPAQSVLQCSEIADNTQRLACFDALANSLRPVAGVTSPAPSTPEPTPSPRIAEPTIMSAPSPAAAAEPVENFGREEPKEERGLSLFGKREPKPEESALANVPESRVIERNDKGEPTKIELRVVDIESVGYNRVRFIMSNGQEWTQVSASRERFPRRFPEEGIPAEIRTAALGSYFLKIDGSGSIKVQRTK